MSASQQRAGKGSFQVYCSYMRSNAGLVQIIIKIEPPVYHKKTMLALASHICNKNRIIAFNIPIIYILRIFKAF